MTKNWQPVDADGNYDPVPSVQVLFERITQRYPISDVAFCASFQQSRSTRSHIYRGTIGNDFKPLALERRLFEVNPLVIHLQRSVVPFDWAVLKTMGPHATRFVDAVAEYGLGPNAISVPMHSPAGLSSSTSFFSAVSSKNWKRFKSAWMGELIIIAQLLHDQLAQELPAQLHGDIFEPLTAVEERCLRLQSEGVTMDDIAERLNITARTVRSHLTRCREKLDASSTAEAIAKMYRFKLW